MRDAAVRGHGWVFEVEVVRRIRVTGLGRVCGLFQLIWVTKGVFVTCGSQTGAPIMIRVRGAYEYEYDCFRVQNGCFVSRRL